MAELYGGWIIFQWSWLKNTKEKHWPKLYSCITAPHSLQGEMGKKFLSIKKWLLNIKAAMARVLVSHLFSACPAISLPFSASRPCEVALLGKPVLCHRLQTPGQGQAPDPREAKRRAGQWPPKSWIDRLSPKQGAVPVIQISPPFSFFLFLFP